MAMTLDALIERFKTIHDLQEILEHLDWDQQVMLPPKGTEQRSQQIATLATLIHEKIVHPSVGEALDEIGEGAGLREKDLADLLEIRRIYGHAAKIPSALVTERAKICTMAQSSWEEARKKKDFAAFRPHLTEVLRVTREVADALSSGEKMTRYDALLDEYEPGMTEVELKGLFSGLKGEIVSLLDRILGSDGGRKPAILQRSYPREQQDRFCRWIAKKTGYDLDAGRLDISVHPFTSGVLRDVRITTRFDEHFLSQSLYGTLHEAGHAMYEQGLDPTHYRNPSGRSCSLGIHESQSRFWENVIGRSKAFWEFCHPHMADFFGASAEGTRWEEYYEAVNVVQPSPIRVEADEVTYNLHIVLRFELESALMREEIPVEDLPEAWNAKMKELLGFVPEDDSVGVLQDIHWPVGLIGYFPTYTLGNLYAAQFNETLRHDLPDLDDRIRQGDFLPINEWLNEKIHSRGRLHQASELCERVTGKPLSIDPAVKHLSRKFSEIYNL